MVMAAAEVVEMFNEEAMEERMVSPMANEALPKRKGWLSRARRKLPPASKKGVKEAFMEKPVRTIPSEMSGYMFTRE